MRIIRLKMMPIEKLGDLKTSCRLSRIYRYIERCKFHTLESCHTAPTHKEKGYIFGYIMAPGGLIFHRLVYIDIFLNLKWEFHCFLPSEIKKEAASPRAEHFPEHGEKPIGVFHSFPKFTGTYCFYAMLLILLSIRNIFIRPSVLGLQSRQQ